MIDSKIPNRTFLKNVLNCLFFNFILIQISIFSEIAIPKNYYQIVEKLVLFKDDDLRIYNGGPIESIHGVKWLMPITFENKEQKTRAIYEINFINCLPEKNRLKNIPVYFIQVDDIDIKFNNTENKNYCTFYGLVHNQNPNFKCVLIRKVDVTNVCYPDLFISKIYSDFQRRDLDKIGDFLNHKYGCSLNIKQLSQINWTSMCEQITQPITLIESKEIKFALNEKLIPLKIDHYYIKDDVWHSYYMISISSVESSTNKSSSFPIVRLDSGCTSGQIYNDSTCDCSDQLIKSIEELSSSSNKDSVIIHIPCHDGRGFGSALKAETEIYKQGGKGRVHTTKPLNTVEAALLLYETSNYDIRSYEGCAQLLQNNHIAKVELITDSRLKIHALESKGLEVIRKKTNTSKESCLVHLQAKKSSEKYFTD
jgi:GTP cyclohydrolase II